MRRSNREREPASGSLEPDPAAALNLALGHPVDALRRWHQPDPALGR
ncbi:hypothetical protein ACFZCP_05500 [Streptomyces sp. NPDC007971]